MVVEPLEPMECEATPEFSLRRDMFSTALQYQNVQDRLEGTKNPTVAQLAP